MSENRQVESWRIGATRFVGAVATVVLMTLTMSSASAQSPGPINRFDPAGDWAGMIKCKEAGDGARGALGTYEMTFSVDISIAITASGLGAEYPYRIIWMYPNGYPPAPVLDFHESFTGFYFANEAKTRTYFGVSGGGTGAVLELDLKPDGSRVLKGESTRGAWNGYGPFVQVCDWRLTSTTPPAY